MKYEDKILKNALQLEQFTLKRRVAEDGAEAVSKLTPYLDKKGAFKLDYLAGLAMQFVNWINSFEEDTRIVTTSDNVQLLLDDIDVPEVLKCMIWPRSIKLDPTSFYMYDLIFRDDADPISSSDIDFLIRGLNAYLYGDATLSAHTVKVGSIRTDVALMNYIDNITVPIKVEILLPTTPINGDDEIETEEEDDSNKEVDGEGLPSGDEPESSITMLVKTGEMEEKYLCKSSLNGGFKVLVDGLDQLMTLEGYFDMSIEDNIKLLEKNFKLNY